MEKKNEEKEETVISKKVGVDYKASANTVVSVEGKLTSKGEKPDDLNKQDSAVDKGLTVGMKRSF